MMAANREESYSQRPDPHDGGYYPSSNNNAGGYTPDPQIAGLQGQISDTTRIMRNNLEATANRGAKVNDLHQASENLQREGQQFRQTSRKTRIDLMKKEWKWRICVIVGIIILLVIIIVPAVVATKNK